MAGHPGKVHITDDAEAIDRARGGDLDAFGVLVARYTVLAHRTAVLLGAGDDADDMVQNAFVKAFRKLPAFRAGSSFRPWLLAIVVNETKNRHREKRRRDGLTVRLAARRLDVPDDPEDDVLAAERRAVLLDAVRALPDRDRMVVTCRYFLDLSEAETAEALGWPQDSVKSRTSRALARLRSSLVSRPGAEVSDG
ncbi:MAG: sigma-70 family RNA polymerase sigma factor [Streptosporangiales bacterium]|nr:sigma-70 family RNA polymerase sigma factor [Streptosporangiales bacterium]